MLAMAAVALMNSSCEKKDPVSSFELPAAEVSEGFGVRPLNRSLNADQYEWTIEPGAFRYTDWEPLLVFQDTGTYTVRLAAISGKNKHVSEQYIRVKTDTMWRLYGYGTKTWIVSSILYGGAELLNQPCQKDDEFVLFHGSRDTFSFTEGNEKCPDGTYLFNIPASGVWRFNRAKKSLDFSLTAFGSPYSFEFVTTKLTNDVFEGYDTPNDVWIKLRRR